MGKKLSVTGALGYIGSWLVKRLLQNGHTVHATLRDPAVANTQIDWKETPDAHILKADLPSNSVKIEVEDGRILQISGERNKEPEQKNEKYHRVERSRGKFLLRFRLPDNAKPRIFWLTLFIKFLAHVA